MKTFYRRIEHNTLLGILSHEEISNALAYLVDFKNHSNLNVIPHPYSIEISNEDITISVILFVGFETDEYKELKDRNNFHIVSFSRVVPEMVEFENLNVKYIDNMSLLFTTMSRCKNELVNLLFLLKHVDD